MEKICGIYKIESPTGKIYIGQSVDIGRRWRYHKEMRDKYKKTILYRSFIKYGTETHIFTLLEECPKDKLNEREKFYIEKYDTFDTKHGMNLTSGGDSNVKMSREAKEKISKAKKGKSIPHLIGFKHDEKTKKRLAELATDNKNWLGKNHSEETKAKIREKRKHQIFTEETRRKLSISSTGRKYLNRKKPSKEMGEKIRELNIGKKMNVKRTSIYYGVSFDKRGYIWRANIKIYKKQKYIGVFKSEVEAAIAYDMYVLKHIPYDVPLNFPERINNFDIQLEINFNN